MEAKFGIGNKAVMMYDNKPEKVTIIERRFIRKEFMDKCRNGEISTHEYVEYTVCTYYDSKIKASNHQLFHTLDELIDNLKKGGPKWLE